MTLESFSFEFFPPKSEQAAETMIQSASTLATLEPAFLSMTYGAGGSKDNGSIDNAVKLQRKTGIPTAAHLTYSNTPRDVLFDMTDRLWDQGIRHIVALRGDLPNTDTAKGRAFFHDTSHFIAALRARHDFEISVGTYPEKHPDSKTLATDIVLLKKKADAGATRAITQFFFNNAAFYRFRDRCAAAGIDGIAIVPGVLPVIDYSGMLRFAEKCAVKIPKSLSAQFQQAAARPAADLTAEILAWQVDDLARHGVDHVHFYTLNKAAPLQKTLAQLIR